MQHAAREPGVERVEPGADVAPEELVLRARQAVGVSRKIVEHLGFESSGLRRSWSWMNSVASASITPTFSIASLKCSRRLWAPQPGTRPR